MCASTIRCCVHGADEIVSVAGMEAEHEWFRNWRLYGTTVLLREGEGWNCRSMTARLSAFLIVKNEAERLPRTLEALRDLADEVVVVDSGSTDATVEIAKSFGARVFIREWPGYGPQKHFAENQCSHDWLLNVDADEVVTPELANEIRSTIDAGVGGRAWRIRIRTVYPGDRKPRPLVSDYNVVRLYHRSVGRYRDDPLFDRVETSVNPGQLRSTIWHYSFVNWQGLLDKANTYTSYYAKAGRKRSRTQLRFRLLFEFPFVFFKVYVLRLHCFGGWKGYIVSVTAAYMRLIRLAKILERQHHEERGARQSERIGANRDAKGGGDTHGAKNR